MTVEAPARHGTAYRVALDSLDPVHAQVGFGYLGRGGELGYGGRLQVGGRSYASALSTHPPARVLYRLDGRFEQFSCSVAMNDDVPMSVTHADFTVIVDGRTAATVSRVRPGDANRPIDVPVAGARLLELRVDTSAWEWCHALWIEPTLSAQHTPAEDRTVIDPLGLGEMTVLEHRQPVERCIATVASAGYERWLENLLGSLAANSGGTGAAVAVVSLGDDPAVAEVVARYRAVLVPCRPVAPVRGWSKAVLYSIAGVIPAERYVCLDADMLILGSLDPLFHALDACPTTVMLACREGNGPLFSDLADVLDRLYGGGEPPFFERSSPTASASLVINDGLLAGRRAAFVALERELRSLPGIGEWLQERPDMWWRNQFVLNVALARLGTLVELDSVWNLQLQFQDVEVDRPWPDLPVARWHDQLVRVLHFNGNGKGKHIPLHGMYSGLANPLVDGLPTSDYPAFVQALRTWCGTQGPARLAWSFNGTADGASGRVSGRDFPLYQAMAALIRANGCRRVLETGTFRGVSAACLSSAVASESDAAVVTFDPTPQPDCNNLWALLPDSMQACIDQRPVDSLVGMRAALEAGERFHAALLDSLHTEEQVLGEFALASQLVCEGGLILIHDAHWRGGSVDRALDRIAEQGYGVTRLWSAVEGTRHDDDLGLAVVECRRRARSAQATTETEATPLVSLDDDLCATLPWRLDEGDSWSRDHGDLVIGAAPRGWFTLSSPALDATRLGELANLAVEVTVAGKEGAAGISFGPYRDYLTPVQGDRGASRVRVEVDGPGGNVRMLVDGALVSHRGPGDAEVAELLGGTVALKAHNPQSVRFREVAIHRFEASCRLSVIITCSRFGQRLRVALANWCRQLAPSGSYEVIIVNPASPDGTHEHIAAVSRAFPAFRLREIPVEGTFATNKGLLINRGVAAASGAWIWLADADCLFPVDAVERVLDATRGDADVVLFGERIHLDERETAALLAGRVDSVRDFDHVPAPGPRARDRLAAGYTQIAPRWVFDRVPYDEGTNHFAYTDVSFIEGCEAAGLQVGALPGLRCLHLAHPFAWFGTQSFL